MFHNWIDKFVTRKDKYNKISLSLPVIPFLLFGLFLLSKRWRVFFYSELDWNSIYCRIWCTINWAARNCVMVLKRAGMISLESPEKLCFSDFPTLQHTDNSFINPCYHWKLRTNICHVVFICAWDGLNTKHISLSTNALTFLSYPKHFRFIAVRFCLGNSFICLCKTKYKEKLSTLLHVFMFKATQFSFCPKPFSKSSAQFYLFVLFNVLKWFNGFAVDAAIPLLSLPAYLLAHIQLNSVTNLLHCLLRVWKGKIWKWNSSFSQSIGRIASAN